MFKKLLILLFLPLGRSFGQDVHEEETTPVEQSKFALEISGIEAKLKNNVYREKMMTIGNGQDKEQNAIEYFDYFPPQFYLNKATGKSAGTQHETSMVDYANVTAEIDGATLENLRCYKIADKYNIAYKSTGIAYHYDNVMFYYEDQSGQPVASVTYIKKRTGILVNETKIVNFYGRQNNEITISPNPAHQFIDLSLNIKVAGDYELNVIDINQKPVAGLIKKHMEPGISKFSVPVNLVPGQYVVVLRSSNSTPTSKKLIIE